MNLEGKTVIVTGASSGIGEATALLLAQHGVNLTIAARRRPRLDSVAARIRACGGNALPISTDLRSETEILGLFEESQRYWGRLEGLVNCAGVGRPAPIHTGSTEAWREMLDVNILAVAIATREALRRFDASVGGHVVIVSSTSAHRVPPGAGFYAATKFAVRAFSEIVRQELVVSRSKSRISTVSPGRVATDFFRSSTDASVARNLEQGTALDPGAVAAVVVHMMMAEQDVVINDVIMRAGKQVT